jgi:hypothetical protein
LADLSDQKIETYLKAKVTPVFPTTLAVAKVKIPYYDYGTSYQYGERHPEIMVLENLQGDEAAGWQKFTEMKLANNRRVIEQIQFLSPLLVDGLPTLKKLRDAAAIVHAPMLLVYVQQDDTAGGYNDAAVAYWTFVGLFFVPGNTVGYYSTCQAILVDTQTGYILATAQSDAMREEKVLPGMVDTVKLRLRTQARAESLQQIQQNCRTAINQMAVKPR